MVGSSWHRIYRRCFGKWINNYRNINQFGSIRCNGNLYSNSYFGNSAKSMYINIYCYCYLKPFTKYCQYLFSGL